VGSIPWLLPGVTLGTEFDEGDFVGEVVGASDCETTDGTIFEGLEGITAVADIEGKDESKKFGWIVGENERGWRTEVEDEVEGEVVG